MRDASGQSGAELGDVLRTDLLRLRDRREPDHAVESRALAILGETLAREPQSLLGAVADTVLRACGADSVAIGVVMDGNRRSYRWEAVAGQLAAYAGSTWSWDEGSCAGLLEAHPVVLFDRPQRRFPWLAGFRPEVCEALVVPIRVAGEQVGNVWAISHQASERFDAEAARQLQSLAPLAAAGVRMLQAAELAAAGRRELALELQRGQHALWQAGTALRGEIGARQRAEFALDQVRHELELELRGMNRLHELGTRLFATTNEQEALEEILAAATSMHVGDRGVVQLVGPGDTLAIAAWRGFEASFIDRFRTGVPPAGSACGRALRTRRQVVVGDVGADSGYVELRGALGAVGVRGVQATPLLGRDGAALGVLSTYSREPRVPAAKELRLTELYARQAAHVIEQMRARESLHASARQLREMHDLLDRVTGSSADLIAALAPDFTFRVVNAAYQREFTRIFGTEVRAGTSLADALAHLPQERNALLGIWRQALEGSPVVACAEFGDPERERRVYEMQFDPVREDAGLVIGAAMVARDVTERTRAEQALRQSEARLQLALDATNLGIWEWDLENDEVRWSDTMFRLTGITPETFAADRAIQRRLLRARDVAMLREGQVPGDLPLQMEFRVVHPDGQVRWLSSSGHLQRGSSGKPMCIVGLVADVTDQKRYARNAMLLDAINAAFAQLTTASQIVAAAGEQISQCFDGAGVSFAEAEAEGGPMVLIHAQHLGGVPGQASDAGSRVHIAHADVEPLAAGRVVAVNDIESDPRRTPEFDEYRRRGVRAYLHAPHVSDARWRFLLTLEMPERHHWTADEIELVRNLCVRIWLQIERARAMDALHRSEQHQRKLSQQLEQRVAERTRVLEQQTVSLRRLAAELTSAEQRARRRLAAVLHDDLQQLLAACRMHLGRLREHHATLPGTRPAYHIERAAQLLEEAVAMSRDLTRQLRPPVLYEAGLVPALEWLATEMAERHELRVTVTAHEQGGDLDDDLKALLFDCTRELLFNAAKYAGVDHASVHIVRDEASLRVVVADRGKGFDAGKLGPSAPSGGFGLFSIRERLAALGGAMRIESAPDSGTRIELDVPLDPASAPPVQQRSGTSPRLSKPAARAPDHASVQPVRVLVADDHAMVREGIATVLAADERLDVVAEAADGLDAIEAIAMYHPDVVLLDFNMPRMSGVEAAREIHERWPELAIIGLSVHGDDATARSMMDAGAVAFVPKSGDVGRMISTILRCARH
jgi:PAS domain S-box-containing protein